MEETGILRFKIEETESGLKIWIIIKKSKESDHKKSFQFRINGASRGVLPEIKSLN